MTDPGLQRDANEDAFVLRPDLGLFVVADGISQSRAGALAAALAVREVERCFEQLRRRGAPGRRTAGEARGHLVRAFERANRRVLEAGQRHPQHRGMSTTLAAMVVARDRVVLAHLGDSRIYRLRGRYVDRRGKYRWEPEVIEQLTTDHTLADDPDLAGPRTTDPRRRQLLTRFIGHGGLLRVATRVEKVGPNDTFLLCTDGLHGVLTEALLEAPLRYVGALRRARDPERALPLPHVQCAFLVGRVKERKAPDNVTLLVARFRKGRGRWQTQRATGCVVHAPPRDEAGFARPPERKRDEDADDGAP
jgi:protein phosphatase